MKIQPAVKKETLRIITGVCILSAIMWIVFFAIDRFNSGVVFGTLLGSGFACLNFFMLALGIQKATSYDDAKKAKSVIQTSYSLRTFAMVAVCIIGFAVPVFNWICVVMPMVFPRIVIGVVNIWQMATQKKNIARDSVIDNIEEKGEEE